jgi:hypothetical protein
VVLGGELEFLAIESAIEEVRKIQRDWLNKPEEECLQWHDISQISTYHAGLTPVTRMEEARRASWARCPGVGWAEKIKVAQVGNSEAAREDARQKAADDMFPSMYFSGCNDHKVALDATWIAAKFKEVELEHMRMAVDCEGGAPGGERPGLLDDGVPGFKLPYGRASHEYPVQHYLSRPHNIGNRGFVHGTSQVVPTRYFAVFQVGAEKVNE